MKDLLTDLCLSDKILTLSVVPDLQWHPILQYLKTLDIPIEKLLSGQMAI